MSFLGSTYFLNYLIKWQVPIVKKVAGIFVLFFCYGIILLACLSYTGISNKALATIAIIIGVISGVGLTIGFILKAIYK